MCTAFKIHTMVRPMWFLVIMASGKVDFGKQTQFPMCTFLSCGAVLSIVVCPRYLAFRDRILFT